MEKDLALSRICSTFVTMRKAMIIMLLTLWQILGVCQLVCRITKYDEDTGMSQWRVTQMVQDKNGLIWFATWNGIDRFDGYEFVNFKPRAGEGSDMLTDRIRDMRIDEKGQIYCKADEEWFCFHAETGKFTKVPERQQKTFDTSNKGRLTKGAFGKDIQYKDRNGVLWTIQKDGRMQYQTDGAIKEYPLDTPFPEIRFSMSDKQGNLWLITLQGVFKLTFSQSPITMFPQEKSATIGAFLLDAKQRYWIATKGADATLRVFDKENRLLGYLTPQGKLTAGYTQFAAPVYCMTQAKDGTFWLGSKPGGLFRMREDAQTGAFLIQEIAGLKGKHVYCVKEDAQGRIWVATMGDGIFVISDPKSDSPSKITGFIGRMGYPKTEENMVRYLHITANNILMAATTEGLLIAQIPSGKNVAQMKFTLHKKEPNRATSLSCNATMDILEDSQHRFFIGTESGGVCRILSEDILADQLEFQHYNLQNGLNSDIALALREKDGQLLIVSSNQIMTLDVDHDEFGFFDMSFFGRSCRFSEVRPLKLPDGRWLFGLQDGAFTVSGAMMHKSTYAPPIVLTGIDKQGKGIEYAVSHLKTIRLLPNERSLTISFSALDYADPAAVTYAFKLDTDEEWNYIGHNHSASFADLKPGTYYLQIRSTNSDGVWVDNMTTVEIIVDPTFLESTIGRLLITLLFLGIIAGIIYTYLYIRRIKRQQRETLKAYLALINESKERNEGDSLITDSPQQPSKESAVVSVEEPHTPHLSPDDEAFMARVMEYVEANIGNEDANVNEMAEATATSKSGLNRKMKSLVGLTPADFLREARIKRACMLLTTTDIPVSDIAYKCGFADPKYFGKCFKTSIGQSPSDYRQQ